MLTVPVPPSYRCRRRKNVWIRAGPGITREQALMCGDPEQFRAEVFTATKSLGSQGALAFTKIIQKGTAHH